MTDSKKRTGLGRGLASLLDDAAGAVGASSGDVVDRPGLTAPIDLIRANPDQPRKTFPPGDLDDLAGSIREHGILQPLLVRSDPDRPGGWRIIAGERRWRAAQAAGVHEAPIVVMELSDDATLEVAIIENIQRADLNPIDEAEGYRKLIDQFGRSQADLARSLGKSRPHIANSLRLLNLPSDVRDHVVAGRLSAGHARALVNAEDPSRIARRAIDEGMTVRQVETLARQMKPAETTKRKRPKKDADTRALQDDLSAALDGLSVSIAHKSNGAGTLSISYRNLDDLDGLCQILMK